VLPSEALTQLVQAGVSRAALREIRSPDGRATAGLDPVAAIDRELSEYAERQDARAEERASIPKRRASLDRLAEEDGRRSGSND